MHVVLDTEHMTDQKLFSGTFGNPWEGLESSRGPASFIKDIVK